MYKCIGGMHFLNHDLEDDNLLQVEVFMPDSPNTYVKWSGRWNCFHGLHPRPTCVELPTAIDKGLGDCAEAGGIARKHQPTFPP